MLYFYIYYLILIFNVCYSLGTTVNCTWPLLKCQSLFCSRFLFIKLFGKNYLNIIFPQAKALLTDIEISATIERRIKSNKLVGSVMYQYFCLCISYYCFGNFQVILIWILLTFFYKIFINLLLELLFNILYLFLSNYMKLIVGVDEVDMGSLWWFKHIYCRIKARTRCFYIIIIIKTGGMVLALMKSNLISGFWYFYINVQCKSADGVCVLAGSYDIITSFYQCTDVSLFIFIQGS